MSKEQMLFDEGNEVAEDVIGVLWEYPLAFQRIFTWRDRESSLDLLSGRNPKPARDYEPGSAEFALA